MTTFETRSRVTPDAKLHVAVPAELANTDVRVTVEPVNGKTSGRAPMTGEEWREFVRATAGSIPDFPDVPRPGPDDYERRESLG